MPILVTPDRRSHWAIGLSVPTSGHGRVQARSFVRNRASGLESTGSRPATFFDRLRMRARWDFREIPDGRRDAWHTSGCLDSVVRPN